MSVEHAKMFVERMKSDGAFGERIIAAKNVGERLSLAKNEGIECSVADVEQLQAVCVDASLPSESLPLSWQCKGPCHTKCADVLG